MKRKWIGYVVLLAAICLLAGCGTKQEQLPAASGEITESAPMESVPSVSGQPGSEITESPSAGTSGEIPEVTEKDLEDAINTASRFAWDWFCDNIHVDHSDVIMDDYAGGEWSYERINEGNIRTVDDVVRLAEQYFTEDVAKELVSYKQWLEKENGLYVSATDGLGDPMIESYTIQMKKDSPTQYTLMVTEMFNGEQLVDPYVVHYQYENGHWVFDHAFMCCFDVPIQFEK
ncbi:MAG: hypothetical protein IIY71_04910 [Oscillospiraceae bacterium]|nr:hypothetical protein [Oscillospiraceae bacterium]